MQRLLARPNSRPSESKIESPNASEPGSSLAAPSAAGAIQTKLEVGSVNDPLENEADRVADQILTTPPHGGSGSAPPTIQRFSEPAHEDINVAPASVDHALSGSSRPLEEPVRHDMEQRFGHDFSQVRVHFDSAAEQSAQDASARAYTVGHDIVFGTGRFVPGTQEGRRLIAHELTHVVQQQRSPVTPALNLGPVARALQRQTQPGTSPSQKQTQPAPQSNPVDYDRDFHRDVGALPDGSTKPKVLEYLNQAKIKGNIAFIPAVKGVEKDSHAEIFLLYVLWQLAEKNRWQGHGFEADVITPIDWKQPGGPPAPLGRVTVRIDSHGNPSVELIAKGSVPQVPQTTYDKGDARLKSDFGFTKVEGWNKKDPKAAAEISEVLAALDLLKMRAPQDVAALNGADLIRVPVPVIITDGESRAAEFSFGTSTIFGGKKDEPAYLKIANNTFEPDSFQFYGGGPNSPTVPAAFQTILHEVGHAVEREALRKARDDELKAQASLDEAKKGLTNPTFDADLANAIKKGPRARDNFYKQQAASHAKAEDQEKKALEDIKTADTERVKQGGDTLITPRLKLFIDLVTAKGIRPFTRHAREHWPDFPKIIPGKKDMPWEFYAEAYSLWLTDPYYLQTNWPDVYEFFKSRSYRNE